ncbi:hypothetical protein [Bradyrhizobium genosp. P]|uniref:hypothetical protein n=1 Tax=Bradyrhizobium genosp. P TaxID=83641 RepID=UPI003CFBAE31
MSNTKKTKPTSPAVNTKTAPGFVNPPAKRGAALQAALYINRKRRLARQAAQH